MAEVHSIQIAVDSTQVNRAATDLNKMAGATSNAEKALGNLIGVAKGLIAFETLRRTASYAIEAADSYTLMASKLKLATSSQSEFTKAQESLFKISQANSVQLESTVDLYARLSRGMKDMGNTQEQILKMTNAVSQALKISGASTAEASSVITQFGQAMGSGVLRGEEFNAIMENGNRLARALADGLGVPISSLRALAEQGKLTGDIVTKAILSQTDALDRESQMMQTTVSQSWVQVKNAITLFIGEADSATGTSKTLADALMEVARAFEGMSDAGSGAMKIIEGIKQAFAGGRGAILEYIDLVDEARRAQQELTGAQKPQATDPETQRLMDMGRGKVSIDELAGKQAEATNKAVESSSKAAMVALGKTSKAAKKAADDAQRAFQETINANVRAAEDAAKLQDAISKTAEMRLENELDIAKEKARVDTKLAKTEEEKIRIAEELAQKSEEIIAKETELRLQALVNEEQILATKIAGVEQEIAAADRYNLTQSERIRLQSELASLQTQQQIIPEERTQIELQAVRELTGATKELNELRKGGEEDVREEALRTLAVFESNLDFAREMATGFADAFGEMGEAIGGMVVSLAEYEKQMATIKIQMEEDIAKNPAKRYEIEQKAAEKSAKAQINAYGDMAQSAQKFFKQGSKGYEAMGAAVKVFRAFEMAQSVISTVSQIDDMGMMLAQFLGMETAKTTAKVASNTAQQASDSQAAVVSAQKAVADSGQGDPYTGIVRAAAMLAFMAAIGIAIGGGSSASASSAPKLPGTGTVLGDPEAQSQSIQNALDTLVEINTNDLSYSAGMLQSLKNIENALASAAALTARMVMPLIDRVMSSTGAGSMLSSSEITKAGFIGQPQLLTEILQSGYMKGGMGYRKETTTLSILNSAEEVIVKWPKKIGETFAKIVDEMFTTIVDSGKSVGVSIETIQERAVGLKLKLGEMNLAGKSSEEQAAAIEAAFSAMGDTMAKKLIPEFIGFEKSGEGYFETIVRVGAGIKDATGRLEQLGYEAIDYTQIINKHGDVAAEIAKQTLVQQALLGEGVKVYVSELQGGVEDVISAYKQLVDVQNIYVGIGGNMDNLTRTTINAAGGLDAFQEAMQTFVQNFLPPAEQIRITGAGLAKDFARFGFTMPQTRDGFAKLVMGLDDSTEAGQKLKGQLIGLTPAFDDYISQVEDLNDEFKDLFANIKDFQSSIRDDIANLTGSSAEFALAVSNAQDAYKALFDQIGYADYRITGSQEEVDLLKEVRSQVMARYNAEVAILRQVAQVQADAIREASAAEIDSVKAASEAQIDAINAAQEAQIDAINASLEAELDLRQKANEAALEGLQKEYDVAQKLKTAVEQVRAYAQGMALGPNAPLSPEARLREAQRQYSDLLSRAQGGDADAIGQLSGAADAYLQASKDYYGSGTQYANVFDGVKKAMESIGSMNVSDPDSIQARIDVLRESQSKELQALRDAAKEQIDALRDANKAQIESIKAATAAQTKQIQDSAQEQIKNLTDIEKNAAIRDLKDRTIIELQNLYELSEKIDAAAKLRQSGMDQVAIDTKNAAQESASYLAMLAGASGSITGGQGGATDTSTGLNSTMQTVATETKASVTIQREAFPKMIERLGELSDRLAKIERNQRLTA